MFTRILHPSEKLANFLEQLEVNLSQPQRRHLLNMADALLVCEHKKTLAALQRQFVEAPDPSNMADFLRISPWKANDLRVALRAQQVAWLLAEAERLGAPKLIYINIDDSLGEKDKHTRHLEPVDWFFDHSESTKTKPRYKNSFCYVVCTMRVGTNLATVDLRLYLREKTVRRLNRKRPKERRIPFRSKYRIARQMLVELAPLLPRDWKVFVQFDSWYASGRLLKFVRRQGWHATCGLKSNRKLDGQRLDHHAQALRHRWYTRVRVTTADGDEQTYYVRWLEGRLAHVPYDVRVYCSKRHPREKSPAYIGCTDRTCSAKQALQGYAWRWSCETVHFYLKTQVGLGDFRVQSYEAVERYMVVVHLAWAYVEQRFAQERSAQVRTYGDLIRQHRDEHARDWLTGALEMVLETGAIEPVLERFLREVA
ncbi:transposase [Candidatus Parcubacteria bacterium]|nr:MAG: transposase [Candidatus Parcubacteria bacterium]